MKNNQGSAFIPAGLLPKYSDDPKLYRRAYEKLRREHDPVYREHICKKERERQKRNYQDPVWRRAKLDKGINRRKRMKTIKGQNV